jgi:hypothetical protein
MPRDARLAGRSFSDLVAILCAALPDRERATTVAIKLDLTPKMAWSGDADAYWTSFLDVIAVRPEKIDELLELLDRRLQGTNDYASLQAWHGRGGQGKLSQAITDLRRSKRELLTLSDPRKPQAQVPLRVMRSAVTEIKEIVTDKFASDSLLLAADAENVASVRSEVLAACRRTLTTLDQLMVGIADAKKNSTEVRQAYGGQEAFVTDRIMVRHLLEERSAVDLDSQTLLDVIDEHLKHLHIPAQHSNQTGQGIPESVEF